MRRSSCGLSSCRLHADAARRLALHPLVAPILITLSWIPLEALLLSQPADDARSLAALRLPAARRQQSVCAGGTAVHVRCRRRARVRRVVARLRGMAAAGLAGRRWRARASSSSAPAKRAGIRSATACYARSRRPDELRDAGPRTRLPARSCSPRIGANRSRRWRPKRLAGDVGVVRSANRTDVGAPIVLRAAGADHAARRRPREADGRRRRRRRSEDRHRRLGRAAPPVNDPPLSPLVASNRAMAVENAQPAAVNRVGEEAACRQCRASRPVAQPSPPSTLPRPAAVATASSDPPRRPPDVAASTPRHDRRRLHPRRGDRRRRPTSTAPSVHRPATVLDTASTASGGAPTSSPGQRPARHRRSRRRHSSRIS